MNNRRQYVIHRRFQWDFTFKVVLALFTPAMVCSLFLFIYLYAGGGTDAGNQLYPLTASGLGIGFVIRLLPLMLATVVFSILFSHRIAGPLKRMQSKCADLTRKNEPSHPMMLRKRDFFHDLANKMNLIVE